MIENICTNISPLEYKLINVFFPGPFTIILNRKDIVPNIVTGNSNTVGVRIPDNEVTKKLIKLSNVPIAAPSANFSGKLSRTTFNDVYKDFSGVINYFIDDGDSKIGIESTIVQVVDDVVNILRPGSITIEEIRKVHKNVISGDFLLPSKNKKHYQLSSPSLLVYSSDNTKMVEKINSVASSFKNPIIICSDENKVYYQNFNTMSYGSLNNLKQIASNLFLSLEEADSYEYDQIIIEGVSSSDLGFSIMNRLLYVCNFKFINL